MNLNWYRNAHFLESSRIKREFAELIHDQLEGKVLQAPFEATYQVFKPSKRRLDKMNVVAITSKFLLDAMSEANVIEDDNDEFFKDEHILPTELDRTNERVVVIFRTKE